MEKQPLLAVPTNIITGFLGVGKTTLIKALLEQKPEDERWAVLVNEFGEVGVDGALFNSKPEQGVFVREVPGGCMCCTSGLPMQIALNQLLAKARPHRLLIEPTGLGHPREVIETLCQEHYQDVLDVRATLTLVDARKVEDERWRDHDTFQQQLRIADYVVLSKSDLYLSDEEAQLRGYLNGLGLKDKPWVRSDRGVIDWTLLDKPSDIAMQAREHGHHHHHHGSSPGADIDGMLAETGVAKVSNEGEGFKSYGWVFPPQRWFDLAKIQSVLSGIDVERLKAVFITDDGIFAFNLADGVLQSFELDESDDSRLEFIAADVDEAKALAEQLEQALFA